jgi:nitroreductase
VVVFKDTAPKEVVEALMAPIAGYQIRYAPVVIVWYLETAAVDEQSDRLRELLKAGALGVGEGKEQELEEKIIPIFQAMLENFKQPGLNEIDCGQGIAQATLMAFEQGLGTCCLGTPHGEQIRQNLGLPETTRVLLLQTVGYPAETPEAGGQRPRQPFEDLFQMNGYDQPFPRSKEVAEELKQDGMLQPQGPLPWREAELEYLQKALGIKGHGLI